MEYKDPKEVQVAILCGGTSGEREISLASGQGAQKALEAAGFNTILLDPANKGDLKRLVNEHFDVAFLCTHGRRGEDGTIQGFLDMINLPYTGSDVAASVIAMDKDLSKQFYVKAGINTAPSLTLTHDDEINIPDIISVVTDYCVVKAATEGSSLGVFIVQGEDQIKEAIKEAFTYDNKLVIEQYIDGTELTVAVIGDEKLKALPIIEIVPQNDSYDFESKYAPGGSEHICPARIPDEVAGYIKSQAVLAHKAIGCYGVSRTDFILDKKNTAWALETNTLPGMTETSLLPDAARAAGIEFPDLCSSFVYGALKRG